MGIEQAVRRQCKQKAVYWGNPQKDGRGGFTYDDPVEIDCRWEEKAQLLQMWDMKGESFECIAIVWVNQDLDQDGSLFLGDLDDLDSAQEESPESISISGRKAYLIRQFEKLPVLGSSTTFVRRAFLSQFQYR